MCGHLLRVRSRLLLHAACRFRGFGAALPVVKQRQLMTHSLLVCTKQDTNTADVFSRSHSMHGACVGTAFGCMAARRGVLHADSVDLGRFGGGEKSATHDTQHVRASA